MKAAADCARCSRQQHPLADLAFVVRLDRVDVDDLRRARRRPHDELPHERAHEREDQEAIRACTQDMSFLFGSTHTDIARCNGCSAERRLPHA